MTGETGVAVIGAGMAGRSHAHAYRTAQTVFGTGAPAVRLVAIADLNSEFATHTAQRYGFERAESSWQAIAEAGDIDAVSIVVANHLHREIAEGLLAAGKHVLCEKPIARSVAEAEAMIAAAAESGAKLMIGHVVRYEEDHRRARELVADGEIGVLRMASQSIGTRRVGMIPSAIALALLVLPQNIWCIVPITNVLPQRGQRPLPFWMFQREEPIPAPILAYQHQPCEHSTVCVVAGRLAEHLRQQIV